MPQYVLLVASLLLATPTTDPVSYEQAGSRAAAARVKNWVSGYKQPGPSISGTGTLTAVDGKAAMVLTAAHLFEGDVGPVTVEFSDGQLSGARILAIDKKLDVAVLWIYAPHGIKPVPISETQPDIGELVEIWGYGPKRFRSFLATISSPIPLDGDIPEALVAAQGIQDKQVTIPGDSGGAMIYAGKLVAVHWGYRGSDDDPRRCVHALGCETLRDWMKQELSPSLCRRCLGIGKEAPATRAARRSEALESKPISHAHPEPQIFTPAADAARSRDTARATN